MIAKLHISVRFIYELHTYKKRFPYGCEPRETLLGDTGPSTEKFLRERSLLRVFNDIQLL
jgi:hypothetical protein